MTEACVHISPGQGLRLHERLALIVILALHAALLGYSARVHSAGWDEVGHLPAGIAHCQTGVFDLYRVNPPLVRSCATVLPYLMGTRLDFDGATATSPPWRRSEFSVGNAWIRIDSLGFQHNLCLARWCTIPFSLWAGWLCFSAARRLYGTSSAWIALGLWCTSPMVLGHASLITPDVGAAATGAYAVWAFAEWMAIPSRKTTGMAGVALGIALLTKFTNVLLVGLLALLVVYRLLFQRSAAQPRSRWCLQGVVIGLLALYVIALGYGFERWGKPLGQMQFVSEAFAGPRDGRKDAYGNRFTDSIFGAVPVPFPENYLSGIDVQKRDFELQFDSYLRGEWKRGGWWYYYLYAFLIKEPLATLVLLVIALVQLRFLPPKSRWFTCVWVLMPMAVTMAFVSSQTGFNHHLRYVMPVYPFVYVLASSVAAADVNQSRWRTLGTMLLLMIAALESLSVYPHSLAFFNQAIGGPDRGWLHLDNSNTDWGQNVPQLAEWARQHPEARPLQIIFSGGFDPKYLPIWDGEVLHRDLNDHEAQSLNNGGALDRWVAISVNKLTEPDGGNRHLYFRTHTPDVKVAYTYHIFNLKAVAKNEAAQP